jgi:predicted small lipoprotein YifL
VYTACLYSIGEDIMRKISGWKTLAILLCTIGLLTSCGLKGDLYLPEGNANTMKVA